METGGDGWRDTPPGRDVGRRGPNEGGVLLVVVGPRVGVDDGNCRTSAERVGKDLRLTSPKRNLGGTLHPRGRPTRGVRGQ